jgi:protein-S-isoprenylcysteine O-methyltransferase Ste14
MEDPMSRLVYTYTGPFMFLLLLTLVFTGNLFSADPFVIAAQVIGLGLIIYARIAFGQQKFHISAQPADGPLLRRGPYRVIRHPMYAGASLLLLVTIFSHLSVLTAAMGVLFLVLLPWRIQLEEKDLRSHYPDYDAYASGTKRLIPYVW